MTRELKTIDLADCLINTKPTPKVRLPWYLRLQGKVERWYVSKVKGINPYNQRIIRFYTYNDEQGIDFDFKCPRYTYDYDSCLYDDFLEVCGEIRKAIHDMYGIPGNYYYDVKVTLEYSQVGNPLDGLEWTMEHYYDILKTDNPRCVEGKTYTRKDCSYLKNTDSHVTICGYHLNGRYHKFVNVLEDLADKIVVVHSHADAKAFLRIMKFLGVNHIRMGKARRYNLPAKYGKLTTKFFGYYLVREDSETVICRMPLSYHPTVSEVLDIDEFIVKRDLKARLRDRWGR